MAFPSTNFVGLFPLQECIFSKDDGSLLSAGIVTFYKDTARTVLKDIYQQVQLSNNTYDFVALDNPLTLSSIGSFQDNNGDQIIPFLFPYTGSPNDTTRGSEELYYITVVSSGGTAQFSREAWPPNLEFGGDTEGDVSTSENIVSNPQFSEVLFVPNVATGTHVYTVTGTDTDTPIAPDWSVITTGSGTVTVSQALLTQTNIASDPAYALEINSASITRIRLRQKLSYSPRLLWEKYASAYLSVKSFGAAVPFTMSYVPETVGTQIDFFTESSTADGEFKDISATKQITGTGNSDTPGTGYVDIDIEFPVAAHVQITSVQVVSVSNVDTIAPYGQESTARQADHLFHYWQPWLNYKPIPSYLVGWDFPLNPAQFATSANRAVAANAAIANTCYYAWDQTIIYQTVASSMTVANGDNLSMKLTCAIAGQFALIQYLGTEKTLSMALNDLAVNIRLAVSTTKTFTVSLYYTTNSAVPVVPLALFSSMDASGKPVTASLTAGWFDITNSYSNGQFSATAATFADFSFAGWLKQIPTTATHFAIVVGSSALSVADTVSLESISCVAGHIPTIPAPQTKDQALSECQYYYETSFDTGTQVPTATYLNSILAQQYYTRTGTDNLFAQSFGLNFLNEKRAIPTTVLYSGATTNAATVEGYLVRVGSVAQNEISSGNWTQQSNGTKGVNFQANSASALYQPATVAGALYDGYITYQYSADARLGIV